MALPRWHHIPVVILPHGDRMIWLCDEDGCDAEGIGADSMNDHMLRTGHEWFEDLGKVHRR